MIPNPLLFFAVFSGSIWGHLSFFAVFQSFAVFSRTGFWRDKSFSKVNSAVF